MELLFKKKNRIIIKPSNLFFKRKIKIIIKFEVNKDCLKRVLKN
jgi:hypothetical protein